MIRYGSYSPTVLPFDPGMFWIVAPGAVRAALPGEHPGVVQGVAWAGHHRMIAAGDEDSVPMLNGISVVERLRIGRIGVHAHESKALFGLDLEIIHLLHGDFRRRHEAVVLMGRTTGPAARPVQCLAGDQVRRVDVIGDVSEYGARPVIFADRFLDGFLGGYVSGPDAGLAGGRGDGDLRRAVETG